MDHKILVGWVVALAAINWGLVGLFNVNVVEKVLGVGTVPTTVVYDLIGLVGLYKLYYLTMAKK